MEIGIKVYRSPTHFGPCLYFNHKMYPFNITEFRQALNYAINKSENAFVSLMYSAKPIEVPTGLPLELVDMWVKPEVKAELKSYKYDPKKAEEMLKSLGFEKGADGIWVAPNGKRMEFELTFPAEFADWAAAAENAAEQLTKLGIKVTLRGITFTQIYEIVMSGKWELAIQGWGAGNPHCFFSFYNDFKL
ncbi:MAG: hypothetical protein DRK00_07560 [Thermoprotei archaeon]|nr:MAG: hypothetical protein DRK00_07560 [Thermoprotei archaeon]